jgi:hypothetical protein
MCRVWLRKCETKNVVSTNDLDERGHGWY